MLKQLEISFTGEHLRDTGIELATNHAENIEPGWKEKTWELFKEFLKGQREPFLLEDFRSWLAINKEDYEWPVSLRAFGYVSVRAVKEKIIEQKGYRKVKNPKCHCTPAAVWRAL